MRKRISSVAQAKLEISTILRSILDDKRVAGSCEKMGAGVFCDESSYAKCKSCVLLASVKKTSRR